MPYERLIRIWSAHDYETVSVTSAAAETLTAAKAAQAERAFITAETAQMRYRYDGTAPTSSEGHLLDIGETLILEGTRNIQNLKIIPSGATSGTIKVTFEV